MKEIKDIAFLVQARLNSERVPNKMIRPFAGTSLLDICLNKIKSSIIPSNQFFLSVHEEKLVRVGERHSVQVFKRSLDSITDRGITLQKIYEWYDKLPFQYYIMVSACHPLLTVETINNFIYSFLESNNDGMFAVFKKRTYYWNNNHIMINDWPSGRLLDTKLVEPIYEAGHCLYAGTMNQINRGIHMGSFSSKNDPELFVIEDDVECSDIDYEWQFRSAESLYEWRYPISGEVIYIDIDNTICLTDGENYSGAIPNYRRIKKANELYESGKTIVYWTARGSISGKDWRFITKDQLDAWGAKYHYLKFSKPFYEKFVCDRALNPEEL